MKTFHRYRPFKFGTKFLWEIKHQNLYRWKVSIAVGFIWHKKLAPINQPIHLQNIFVSVCATKDFLLCICTPKGCIFSLLFLGLYRRKRFCRGIYVAVTLISYSFICLVLYRKHFMQSKNGIKLYTHNIIV